jgi:hypothetical protein
MSLEPTHAPLFELIRRGEAPTDVRRLAAQGELPARAHEQLALLAALVRDADPDVAAAAQATLAAVPPPRLAAVLRRSEVPPDLRAQFAVVVPDSDIPSLEADAPLIEVGALDEVALQADDAPAAPAEEGPARRVPVSSLPVIERVKLAMRGTREQRTVLVRDPNRLVAAAVLSCPKLSESEVEGFARMTNVSEDVLRVIGTTRHWMRNYGTVAALARNPKTPLAISMPLITRLNDRDIKSLSVDRNVPEGVRVAARKLVAASASRQK